MPTTRYFQSGAPVTTNTRTQLRPRTKAGLGKPPVKHEDSSRKKKPHAAEIGGVDIGYRGIRGVSRPERWNRWARISQSSWRGVAIAYINSHAHLSVFSIPGFPLGSSKCLLFQRGRRDSGIPSSFSLLQAPLGLFPF